MRAAVDFNCGESEVHTITIDDRTREAWGCGQRAVYIESCEECGDAYYRERCNCTWVLNSHRKPKDD